MTLIRDIFDSSTLHTSGHQGVDSASDEVVHTGGVDVEPEYVGGQR